MSRIRFISSLRASLQFAAATACLAVVLSGCSRSLAPAVDVSAEDVATLRKAMGGADEAAATTAVVAADPTGWADITGSFRLVGNPPPPLALDVSKDQAVCAPGGHKVFSESLVVDPASGGIRDVLIYLSQKIPDDEKWVHANYAATATAPVVFDQKACVFLTHLAAFRSTQPLQILNSDPVGHNTNIEGGGNTSPLNAIVSAGGKVEYKAGGESPTPFNVACSIHPWMSAKMIVRNSPYFAVTKADGTFEIKNVPAGVSLEFKVWQEKAGFVQNVSVGGKATKWNKGKLPLTLTAGEPLALDVTVDAAAFSK